MPFPQTSLVDDFNRADANPISGDWATTQGGSPLKIVSNAAMSAGATGVTCGSYSKGSPYGPDQECFVDITTLPAITTERVFLTLRSTDNLSPGSPPSDTTSTFYALFVTGAGGYELRRYVNGAIDSGVGSTSLTTGSTTLSAGDTIGFRVIGTMLEGWIKHGGVWSLVLSFNDTNLATRILTGGWIALLTESTTAVLDNFGGGGIGIAQRRPLVEMYSQGRQKRALALRLVQPLAPVVVVVGDITIAVGAATAFGVSPTAIVQADTFPSPTTAMGLSPSPVIDVRSLPAAVTAPALAPPPTTLATVFPLATVATGSTPAPVVKDTAVVGASLASGSSPPPVENVTSGPTASTALGSSPAPVVLVVVPIGPSTAVGSTPAPTVITGSGSTVVVSAALALGLTPAPVVLVVTPTSAALAAGTSVQPTVLVRTLLAAALATGSTPNPTVIAGIVLVAAALGITDLSGPSLAITSANIVSTSAIDVTKAGVTATDTPGTQIASRDVTRPNLTIADKAP